MMNLTINGFVNEMSYDLSLEELETIIFDYQELLIEYFVNNRYNNKLKKEFREVCDVVSCDKYFKTLASLINQGDDRIKPDMAYVLTASTSFPQVDEETKGEALTLAYKLREDELGMVIEDMPTNICILIASTMMFREYESTPFIRTKTVENIIKDLPEILYNAYHEKYEAKSIPTSVILTILTKAIPDLKPEEVVIAFCKTDFPKLSEEISKFALRLRAFLYDLCGRLNVEQLKEALFKACKSISNFNSRTKLHETFTTKYLDFRLLSAINEVGLKERSKVPNNMKKAYKTIKDFKNEYTRFEDLF
jgi:hypothetical protein